jgi:hypothetical protein
MKTNPPAVARVPEKFEYGRWALFLTSPGGRVGGDQIAFPTVARLRLASVPTSLLVVLLAVDCEVEQFETDGM